MAILYVNKNRKDIYFDLSTNKTRKNVTKDSCNWEGVACDISGHVTSLLLDNESIKGGIENSTTFQHLEKLNLAYNNFNTFNILSNNSLSGSIPQSLFNLPSLQKLMLSHNKFRDRVNEISILNPSNIDTLDLSSNRLEGTIPESFFKLERLYVHSLSYNFFNGTITLEKIQNLCYNNLSVEVSSSNSELSQFPQLVRVNLASCNLHEFPDLAKQNELLLLDLSNNKITGVVPNWIWEIGNGELFHLNLSCNSLVDLQKPYNIPTELLLLDLHSNMLQGTLPMPPESAIFDIGNFTSFTSYFYLAYNSLTGTIPTSLCNAMELKVLDLSGNFLSGGIPPFNCGLKTLDLSRNNIEEKIPTSLANCQLLEVLNIGYNKINDGFPCMLKNSSSLKVLVLRSNDFYTIIDIAFNSFNGSLSPRSISSWSGMKLSNNAQLSRTDLDFSPLNLSILYYQDTLIVTMKGLEMELLKILTIFTTIDFSSNNFHGDTIGELSSLYLELSKNKLTGEIPEQLTSLTFLSVLNLSYNRLVGIIPIGSQFQTFSSASYAGNTGLCEFPLNTSCDSEKPTRNLAPSSSKRDFDWHFIVGLGYATGILIMVSLAFCNNGTSS
ncbi:hypothetical protein ACJIZ3_022171 [Penstemon smallii]|uniref:Leucine-rich repeat-containing N-terminal plant-type domain-containing protein n=1 Tax=Penstemon smallii TaxID=265156 RepID=A0ABD3SNH1_9LAMI